MPIKILIADEMHPSLFEMLTAIGVFFTYLPKATREDILEEIPHYQGLIIRSKTKIDLEFFEKTKNLLFIARAGAGLDLIDIEEANKRNIALFAANEGNKDAVAEHTIGMILSLFHKINLANSEVKNSIWQREPNRGLELKGKTWAIIGFGHNGQATAEKLAGFGMKILAYDKFKTDFNENLAQKASLEQIFEKADIVSLHIPLTSETERMVNAEFLNKFHKNIFLINIARGEIVVLADLLHSIKSGKVLGACLDVLENEKIKNLTTVQQNVFNELVAMPNTIFTPHVAGWTHESYHRINEVLVGKISCFLANHK